MEINVRRFRFESVRKKKGQFKAYVEKGKISVISTEYLQNQKQPERTREQKHCISSVH